MRQWIQLMIKYRKAVIALTGLLTILLLTQLSGLQIIIDPDNILPRNHHFVKTNDTIEETFGNKFTVVIGLSPKSGDIYQTKFLNQVKEITKRIEKAPGAIKSHINGFATSKAKQIIITPEGPVPVRVLDKTPETAEELSQFKAALHSDPVFKRLL